MDAHIMEILAKLNSWEQKIEKIDKLDSIEQQLGSLHNNIEQLNDRMALIEHSQSTHTNEVAKIRTDLEQAKNEINLLKQEHLSEDFVIYGLPPDVKTEDSAMIIKNFCGAIETAIEDTDVKKSFTRLIKNKSESIIVGSFSRTEVKQKVMKAFREKKPVPNEDVLDLPLTSPWRGKPITIRNQLTSHNRLLLTEAKKLNEGVFKYIWESNGKIMVRKDDGIRPFTVFSLAQFSEKLSEARQMQTD